MIHYDYLLRLIEEFTRTLSRVAELKAGPRREEAGALVDQECLRLVGVDRASLIRLSAMETLARLARTSTALEIRHRALFLVALLVESADLEERDGDRPDGRAARERALELLLGLGIGPDSGDHPTYAPTVEALRQALDDAPLPPALAVALMHHYERTGAFARAEDTLHEILEQLPGGGAERNGMEFGVAFYRRLRARSDGELEQGGLPRAEVESGLVALEERQRRAGGYRV